jgi:hypothetical protein
MEFVRLSTLTGDPKYGHAAEHVISYLHDKYDQVLPLLLWDNFLPCKIAKHHDGCVDVRLD